MGSVENEYGSYVCGRFVEGEGMFDSYRWFDRGGDMKWLGSDEVCSDGGV